MLDYSTLFDKFTKMKVLVVGDVMIDSYLWGRVDRVSPEAPVPVVAVKKRSYSLGGAANVALNIRALGATPVLCSVIGDDTRGKEFVAMLREEKLSTEGIRESRKRITTTKFRIFGNNFQMLRVDEEITADLEPDDERDLRETVIHLMEKRKVDAVIFQDYDKGVITRHIIQSVIEKANSLGIPVAVDPKKKNFGEYRNVNLFKPNLKEVREGLKLDIHLKDSWELENAANILHREQKVNSVFVTLSDAGVFISSPDAKGQLERHYIPAHVRSIADVSGAGDTVISVAALCMAAGLSSYDIARISNLAGGLVCEEAGVVPVNREKLFGELSRLPES